MYSPLFLLVAGKPCVILYYHGLSTLSSHEGPSSVIYNGIIHPYLVTFHNITTFQFIRARWPKPFPFHVMTLQTVMYWEIKGLVSKTRVGMTSKRASWWKLNPADCYHAPCTPLHPLILILLSNFSIWEQRFQNK